MRADFQHKSNPKPVGERNDAYLAHYTADALLTSWADVAIASTLLKVLPSHLERVTVRSARDLIARFGGWKLYFCGGVRVESLGPVV